MDALFKDDCMFVNSKLRWDQKISIIFASEKEKEKVSDVNYKKIRSKKDDKDLEKRNDKEKEKDKERERKDEDVDKDKKERDKLSDAVSIKILRESTGFLVTLSKVITVPYCTARTANATHFYSYDRVYTLILLSCTFLSFFSTYVLTHALQLPLHLHFST